MAMARRIGVGLIPVLLFLMLAAQAAVGAEGGETVTEHSKQL
jgi:hypothetical protein